MKNKFQKYLFSLCLLAATSSFTSCNFLDIVPDERAQEQDAYKDYNAARGFLYSCYGFMPNPLNGPSGLDLFTGDEVVSPWEHETFANFPKGNFTAANPVISYWNTLYGGIRQSYTLKKNLHRVPDMRGEDKEFQAELDFLIGYYHMLLFRCYGPIIIVEDEVDITTDPSNYLGRSSLDATVKFIVRKFDEAIQSGALPDRREGESTGRATTVIAKALKAYTLMYYASPLLNGNAALAGKLKNIDGSEMISATYDPNRWVEAKKAYKEAIDAAEAAGHKLFTEVNPLLMQNKYPKNETLRALRMLNSTKVVHNPEIIWAKAGDEGPYSIQYKSMPYVSNTVWGGLSPTLTMVRRFYTKNGLPYNVDPANQGKSEFEVVNLTVDNATVEFANETDAMIAMPEKQTPRMNIDREPRYYAWIAFHNGLYELRNNGGYTDANGFAIPEAYADMRNKLVVTEFTKEGNCGRKNRSSDYAPAGFLNKKAVHPDNQVRSNGMTMNERGWSMIRLAEMYLSYAECCAEAGDDAEAKKYLNKVRERAGIPTVEASWALVGKNPTGKELVDIIRQERQIELYLENHNFWDMRRWLLADKYFNVKPKGMNIEGNSTQDFAKEAEINVQRQFLDAHWLLPIPTQDINNNHNVVQNPGY